MRFTPILAGLVWLLTPSFAAATDTILYDRPEVNGHPGFLSAWAVDGPLDRVLLIVPGFDTDNSDLPADELWDDFAPVVFHMLAEDWDVVLFDYVDGAMDLRDNADNLARFIEYLDTQASPGYELAVIGGSMGGIVTRTMFVQEDSDMGVDTYVSLDAPHWGVYLSRWADDLAALALDQFEAAHQMYSRDPAHKALYGWLREVEFSEDFRARVNDPMDTLAITLSDASDGYWKVSWEDLFVHNKYYPVASYVNLEGLRSSYMPYHSTAYLDSPKTKRKRRLGYNRYRYRNKTSSYFDLVIPNSRDEHGAPDHTMGQALEFVLQMASPPVPQPLAER